MGGTQKISSTVPYRGTKYTVVAVLFVIVQVTKLLK